MLLLTFVGLMPAYALIQVPTLSAYTGFVGDEITVSGSGASPGAEVEFYWDIVAAQGFIKGGVYADIDGNYSSTMIIPEDVNGDHIVYVKDVTTASTAGIIFTILAKITLTPSYGLPGDLILVTGTGFSASEDVTITLTGSAYPLGLDVTPTAGVTTDSDGSFAAYIVVPDVSVPDEYGDYIVRAEDDLGVWATATLTIDAYIIVTPDEGPTGIIVVVSGRGFPGDLVDIHVQRDATWYQVLNDVEINNGVFQDSFVMPDCFAVLGVHQVRATDDNVPSKVAYADFDLTGMPGITLVPDMGPTACSITITGVNFTQIAGTEVEIYFGACFIGTCLTEADGTFTCTLDACAMPPGYYTVLAVDETYDDVGALDATAIFRVYQTFACVTPDSGATCSFVDVYGIGFTPFSSFNVTVGGELLAGPAGGTGVVNYLGEVIITGYIPTLPVGTYLVVVMDAAGLMAECLYTVTETTTIVATPGNAPLVVGYVVDVEGWYFAEQAGLGVTLYLYNTTDILWTGTSVLDSDGMFSTSFAIQDDWALGAYKLNATDLYGQWAEIDFNIVEPVYQIWPRADEYLRCDKVSFYVNCTYNFDMLLNITDAEGYNFVDLWIGEDEWKLWYDWYIIPYFQQWADPIGLYYTQHYLGFEVPNDAALGTWSWTAVNLALAPTEIVASGTFVVTEDISNSDILAMLEECCPIIMEIHETTVTINTTLGVIQADLSDIGASVTSIEGDVATISTDIGTLTGTVTSIEGDVATIVTDLGTVKLDVTAIKDQIGDPVDLTPMWAAVVLSLIAALASIWAVLSISRRIA
jgi:hypothetical protein